MIPAHSLAGKRAAVFGLAGTGASCVRSLAAAGARVLAWDDTEVAREKAAAEGVALVDLHRVDFRTLDCLLLSPGVPLTHPEPHWTAALAAAAGVEVIGDTEIFFRELAAAGGAPVVCITGTNGKSTTTALIGHLLRHAGRDVEVGGNIGTPVLALEPPRPGRHYVLELSSYQIDLTPSLRPTVGVLLNLTPDHLDRHGSMEHYAEVKARLFGRQEPGDTAVIGIDDEHCARIADALRRATGLRRIAVTREVAEGAHAREGTLFERRGGATVATVDLRPMATLRGEHNWQNACAAYAAGRALGLAAGEIEVGLRTFPGLAHRMEEVGRLGRVRFINDSKATNADAAGRALACFDTVYWIAGGLPKAGGIGGLERFFPKVVRAYLVGEAAEAFARTLAGKVRHAISGTLEAAVAAAARDAQADARRSPVVLLSPACASFDQYANFEARGDAFRAAVAALAHVTMKQGRAA